VLLQDVDIDDTGGFHGSRRFEHGLLQVLEGAYESLETHLGLSPPRKIRVVVYDPVVFDETFSGLFRFSAAGFYADVIRIRGATVIHEGLVRVLHHELVHAALHVAKPSLAVPAWLNEGLAEWFEARTLGKRHLSPAERSQLERAARQGALFEYDQLATRSFGYLASQSAQLAYLQSYALIEYLVRRHGERKLSDLVDALIRTGDPNLSLQRVYRANLHTLQGRLFDELQT